MKMDIKQRITENILFSAEKTTIKEAVIDALNKKASLSKANLSGADLSGADLSGANFSWADLSRATLSRATLSKANLSGANLSGADLSGTDLLRITITEKEKEIILKNFKWEIIK